MGSLNMIAGPSNVEATFAWGDASPLPLADFILGNTIFSISVVILEAFDGVGAQLSIGMTGLPTLFMATNECDPTVVGSYMVSPGYKFTGPGTVRLFITPGAGASKGNGVITINY